MKYQALFSLKNNENVFMNVVCSSAANVIGALRVNFCGLISMLQKASTFCDYMFASVGKITLPKRGQLIKREKTPVDKGGKNDTGRVAPTVKSTHLQHD